VKLYTFSDHFVLVLYQSFAYEQQFHFRKLIIALENSHVSAKDSPQPNIGFKSLCCARVSDEEGDMLAQAKASPRVCTGRPAARFSHCL